jgi:hypothetical protein
VTPDRARAYRQVVKILRESAPSKLLASEKDRIREAADHLVFAHDLLADEAARTALQDVELLCAGLVESSRWEHESAMRLADEVSACGPALFPELLVA